MIKPQYTNDNKPGFITADDIDIVGIAPVARATYTATGARTLCNFAAFIKPLKLTIFDLTLLHHDKGKFSLSPLSGMGHGGIAKLRWMTGGPFDKAITEAAGRAWNKLSAEEVKELRALYAEQKKKG